MCSVSLSMFWSSWLLPLRYLAAATGLAQAWSQDAALRLNSIPQQPMRRRGSPILRLHVQTLRLNPHAGKRQRYAMRALRLVPKKSS